MFKNAKIISVSTDPEKYFTTDIKRGDPNLPVSSSMLKVFNKCASRWLAGYETPESKALNFGSLVDCLVLAPEEFNKRFAVRPKSYVDEKGVSKEWHHASHTCKAWLREHAKFTIITEYDLAEARKAAVAIRKDVRLKSLLEASDAQVWLAGEWHDENGITIPVKALVDFIPRADTEFVKNVGDLKTSRNGEPLAWARQVYDLGYHIQAAFNLDLYRSVRPKEDRCNFCHVVVENYPPYQIGRRILSDAFLELGRIEYRRILKNYCYCLKTGHWPDYDDTDESSNGWSITEPTPWMESASLFAPRMAEKPEASEEEETNPDTIP